AAVRAERTVRFGPPEGANRLYPKGRNDYRWICGLARHSSSRLVVFPGFLLTMTVLLQLVDAHKRYGDQALLDGAEVTLTDDYKYGFVVRNGAGKSTLCRILLGDEELDSGQVVRHPKLRLGYLRQHDPFLPGETVLEFLMRDSGQ